MKRVILSLAILFMMNATLTATMLTDWQDMQLVPQFNAVNPNYNAQNQQQGNDGFKAKKPVKERNEPDSGLFVGYYSDNLFSRYGLDVGVKYIFNSVKATVYWQGGLFNRLGPDYTDDLGEVRNSYTISEKAIGLEFMTAYDIPLALQPDFFMAIRCGIGYGWTLNSNTFSPVYESSQPVIITPEKHLRIKVTYYYEIGDLFYLETGPAFNIYFDGLKHEMGKPVQFMWAIHTGLIF